MKEKQERILENKEASPQKVLQSGQGVSNIPQGQQKEEVKEFKVKSEMTRFLLQNGHWKLENLEQSGGDICPHQDMKVPWDGQRSRWVSSKLQKNALLKLSK